MDDDVSWNSIAAVQEKEEEEDEGDMPVVSRELRKMGFHKLNPFLLRSTACLSWGSACQPLSRCLRFW